MRRRAALIAASWMAGALLAATGITAAINFLGNGLLGPRLPALSPAAVRSELAQHQPAAPSRSAAGAGRHPSSPASPLATPTARSFTGGTVYSYCSAGRATLTATSPAPGYGIDELSPGPAATVSVRFKSGTTEEIVTVTCVGARPSFTSTTENRGGDHGGGSPGGGGGHG